MTRLPARIAMLLAALSAAWQPSIARAGEEDTQLWVFLSATGPLDDDTRLTIDTSQRWRSAARGDEQQTIRILVEQQVAERLALGGAVAVFEAGGLSEFRLDQQAVVTLGRFALRSRIEERFFDGADRMEVRLRQRVLYNQPLARDWRATLHGEWFGIVQSRRRDVPDSAEWRAQLSLFHRLGNNFEVGANYLFILVPNGDRPDRITHVPQATVTYRF